MMDERESESDRLTREMFERSLQESGRIELRGHKKWLYRLRLFRNLSRNSTPRPLTMILFISVCKRLLRRMESRSEFDRGNGTATLKFSEKIEALRFAVDFGRLASKKQREWFFEQKDLYQIPNHDARFLAWTGILWLKVQRIQFGRWLWISGIFMMIPVLMLTLFAISSCYCSPLDPVSKTELVVGYLAMSFGLFMFYKTRTFDVYRVGQRYFVPDGTNYLPNFD